MHVEPPSRNAVGSAVLLAGVIALVFALVPSVGEFVAVLGLIGFERAEKGAATNGGQAIAGGILGILVFLTLIATLGPQV